MRLKLSTFTGSVPAFGREVEVAFDHGSLKFCDLTLPEAQMLILMAEKVSPVWKPMDDAVILDDPKPVEKNGAEKHEAPAKVIPLEVAKEEPLYTPEQFPLAKSEDLEKAKKSVNPKSLKSEEPAPVAAAAISTEKRKPGRPSRAEMESRRLADEEKAMKKNGNGHAVEVIDKTERAVKSVVEPVAPWDEEGETPKIPSFSSPDDLPEELRTATKLSHVLTWCQQQGAKTAEEALDWVLAIHPHHSSLSKHGTAVISEKVPRVWAELEAAAVQ